jgi:hypothetical protein
MSQSYQKRSPEEQQHVQSYINERWSQLYGLVKAATSEAFSFTFLTNAGGAIAVLGFMGASEIARSSAGAKTSLLLFALGVVSAGLLRLFYLRHVTGMLNSWASDAKRFYADQISEEQMDSDDDVRTNGWLLKAQYAFGYAAFLLFVSGCVAGYISL